MLGEGAGSEVLIEGFGLGGGGVVAWAGFGCVGLGDGATGEGCGCVGGEAAA
jgi:hypothetical protein